MIVQFPIQNIRLEQERRYINRRLIEIQEESANITTHLKELEVEAFDKAAKYYELSTEALFLAARQAYLDATNGPIKTEIPYIQLELPYVYT
jgi:hypothetical protein